LIYGKNLEDSKYIKSLMIPIIVVDISSNLNLTVMVESKQNRIVRIL